MPSAAATLAGRAVIEQTGVDPARIGVLVSTSVSRDYVEPSNSCFVHRNLGLGSTCLNFDLGNDSALAPDAKAPDDPAVLLDPNAF